ncbi:hypothetical protein OS493_024435, partial [Desmophyllum pertusum]
MWTRRQVAQPSPKTGNPLSVVSPCLDPLLGAEECRSPFGTYELTMPIDKTAPCSSSKLTDKNCKDFD